MELEFIPELPGELEPHIDSLEWLVALIGRAWCTPLQSQYEVREGIIFSNGQVATGGNHEYGKTCALHGEESLLVDALKQGGIEWLDTAIALAIQVRDTVVPQPCGNCRDVLATYFLNPEVCYKPELPILGIGPEKDGVREIAVARLKDYYFEDFKRYEGPVSKDLKKAIKKAARAHRFAYNIYDKDTESHPTGAAAIARRGKKKRIYPGTFVGDVAYHPLGAPGNAKAAAYADGAVDIEAMVIVADWMPHVPYKQRQYLVEISPNLEVYLVALSANEIYKTTPEEMLPNNFGPHNLGMTGKVEEWKESIRKKA